MQEELNYTIAELLQAASRCEQYEEYDIALKYYREVLKIDPNQSGAKLGTERNINQLAKTVYFKSLANLMLMTGRLELRRGLIVFVPESGAEVEYEIERIENPRIKLGRLTFDYDGRPINGYSCNVAKKWVALIGEVKEGRYPESENGMLNTLEKYVRDNYTLDGIEDAAQYFKDITGCTYSDARVAVRRVLY